MLVMLGIESKVWSLTRLNVVYQCLIAWSNLGGAYFGSTQPSEGILPIVVSPIWWSWSFHEFVHQAAERVVHSETRCHLGTILLILLALDTLDIAVWIIEIHSS